jgi:hypothetical protein
VAGAQMQVFNETASLLSETGAGLFFKILFKKDTL